MTGDPWHRLIPLTVTLSALALVVAGASGVGPRPAGAVATQDSSAGLSDLPADGRLDVPPLPPRFEPMPRTPEPAKPKPAAPPAAAYAPELAAEGIPAVALAAYRKAEQRMTVTTPGCHLRWYFVAAIGRVESDHGLFGGARLLADGTSDPKVLGPRLNGGPGFATVRDTDHGRYDGDLVFDRAVGPMQFIPSTWAGYAADGNGDGKADPFNLFDAALAAAAYLCNGHDLATLAGQQAAIHNYNHSDEYVALVLAIAREYAHGVQVVTLPPEPGTGKLPTPPKGPQPPASVGHPPAGKPGAGKPPTTPPPSSAPPTSTPPTSTPPGTPTDPPTSPSDPPTSTEPPSTTPEPPPTTVDPPPSTPDDPPTTTQAPATTSDAPPSSSAAPSTGSGATPSGSGATPSGSGATPSGSGATPSGSGAAPSGSEAPASAAAPDEPAGS